MVLLIVMMSVGALVVSTAVAVLIGKTIAHADRIDSGQRWGRPCTGCGLSAIDSSNAADQAVASQLEWSHDDGEAYCPGCTETRFRTWGYGS